MSKEASAYVLVALECKGSQNMAGYENVSGRTTTRIRRESQNWGTNYLSCLKNLRKPKRGFEQYFKKKNNNNNNNKRKKVSHRNVTYSVAVNNNDNLTRKNVIKNFFDIKQEFIRDA